MIARTLPNSLQEFFDNAWTHAVVEKHPRCVGPPGAPGPTALICRYRCHDPEGDHSKDNACLIGCSIPEDRYSPAMENRSAFNAIDMASPGGYVVPDGLYDLQQVHDATKDSTYLATVEAKLRNLASQYGLIIPGEVSL